MARDRQASELPRCHSDIGLGDSGRGFFTSFLHARPLSAQHIQGDQQKNDAGSELKGRHRDARNLKSFARDREDNEHASHNAARQAGHAHALFGRVGRVMARNAGIVAKGSTMTKRNWRPGGCTPGALSGLAYSMGWLVESLIR